MKKKDNGGTLDGMDVRALLHEEGEILIFRLELLDAALEMGNGYPHMSIVASGLTQGQCRRIAEDVLRDMEEFGLVERVDGKVRIKGKEDVS